MAPYGEFRDLSDYLKKRCRRDGLSLHAASDKLKATASYVHDLVTRRIRPSEERCDAIAALFGDSPRVVRILAGRETPPLELDPDLSALLDLVVKLPPTGRDELLRYAHFLASQSVAAETVS